MTSLYKKIIGLALIVIAAVAGWSFTLQQQEQEQLFVLSFHCKSINDDVTRPMSRHCISPVSLKNNVFVFKTLSGKNERYLIIGTLGNSTDISHNSFVYDFIDFI